MASPITSVNGVSIPTPSSYKYVLEDISAADAGRTEDTVMHKKRIGQVIALELEWQNIPTSTVSTILQAFDPEYISVTYLDAKQGGYKTSTFYVGNRSAPMYNASLGLWSNVAFKIVKRSG